jgi:hypothetical protein
MVRRLARTLCDNVQTAGGNSPMMAAMIGTAHVPK